MQSPRLGNPERLARPSFLREQDVYEDGEDVTYREYSRRSSSLKTSRSLARWQRC